MFKQENSFGGKFPVVERICCKECFNEVIRAHVEPRGGNFPPGLQAMQGMGMSLRGCECVWALIECVR